MSTFNWISPVDLELRELWASLFVIKYDATQVQPEGAPERTNSWFWCPGGPFQWAEPGSLCPVGSLVCWKALCLQLTAYAANFSKRCHGLACSNPCLVTSSSIYIAF